MEEQLNYTHTSLTKCSESQSHLPHFFAHRPPRARRQAPQHVHIQHSTGATWTVAYRLKPRDTEQKIFRFPGGEQAWRTLLSARAPGGGVKKRKFLLSMSSTYLETLWAEACFPSCENGSPGCSYRFKARSHCCRRCSTVPLSAHKPTCHPYNRLGEAKFAKTADAFMQFRDKCKRVARGLFNRRTED